MAVCTRSAVKMSDIEYIPSINALKFNILNTSSHEERTFTFLLLYRKQSVNSAQYIRNLTTVVNCYSIAVILGDFNINYLNSTEAHTLKSVMESLGYTQMVVNPTFISGSLLDHVYIRLKDVNITVHVINVYYSDHDAIQLTMQY